MRNEFLSVFGLLIAITFFQSVDGSASDYVPLSQVLWTIGANGGFLDCSASNGSCVSNANNISVTSNWYEAYDIYSQNSYFDGVFFGHGPNLPIAVSFDVVGAFPYNCQSGVPPHVSVTGAINVLDIPISSSSQHFEIVDPAGLYMFDAEADCDVPYDPNLAPITVSVENIMVKYPDFDLAVTVPIVSQSGSSVSSTDGLLQIAPGAPVQINVPVRGFKFNSPERRSTVVTVQAGSQLLSQTISLADIQSTGTLIVPFNVTFGASDIGVQTITATVDPGNALNESDFSNNTSSVQVEVVVPYKLTVQIQSNNGTWQDVPDEGGIFSPVPSDFVLNTYLSPLALGGASPSQPQKLKLGCVDPSTYPPTPVSGCQFQIQPLTAGTSDPYSNGGHTHSGGQPLILTGAESLFSYDGGIHTVDVTGQSLTYWPPIEAGDVVVNIKGFDIHGNPIQGAPPITFRVKVSGLQPLAADTYELKCALTPNDSGCPGGGYQHTNFYNVTANVNAAMSKIGFDYGDAVPTDPDLVITDASLAWGGLYDYTNSWAPPHKYHRQGTDVDVRRSTISDEAEFKIAVCDNGGYPLPEDALHYHLFFYPYAGSKSISALCN